MLCVVRLPFKQSNLFYILYFVFMRSGWKGTQCRYYIRNPYIILVEWVQKLLPTKSKRVSTQVVAFYVLILCLMLFTFDFHVVLILNNLGLRSTQYTTTFPFNQPIFYAWTYKIYCIHTFTMRNFGATTLLLL